MKDIRFSKGTNLYDFFVLPTIRIHRVRGIYIYLTVEWLRWYIGLQW